jgi:hypothetical protein
MNKRYSFLFMIIFLLVLCMGQNFPAVGAESACEEASAFIVTIQHEYSLTKPNYTPSMFSELYIERVEPIMLYRYTEIPGSLYNKEAFQDILVLVLNEIGEQHIDAVEESIAELPFVVNVSRKCAFEPELSELLSTRNLGEPYVPDLEAPPGTGDIDLDGNITVKDARLALRISLALEYDMGPGTNYYYAADVNKDGVVYPDDARTILRLALGLD